MHSQSNPRYRGVFPVVPTTFTTSGELDLPSQLRCVDFMILENAVDRFEPAGNPDVF